MPYDNRPLDVRLTSRIKYGPGCWIWIGVLDHYGYGRIRNNNKHLKAHRLTYELFNGCIVPDDMSIDHSCMVKACVNPDHLEVVTRGENARRGHERGEYPTVGRKRKVA